MSLQRGAGPISRLRVAGSRRGSKRLRVVEQGLTLQPAAAAAAARAGSSSGTRGLCLVDVGADYMEEKRAV
jgi:hypothetical protein